MDEGDANVISTERNPNLSLDIGEFLSGDFIPASLQVAAVGNPVAQALLQMLRFEREHLDEFMRAAPSTEAGLAAMIGAAEEGTVETKEAAYIYDQARMGDGVPSSLRVLSWQDMIEMLMARDGSYENSGQSVWTGDIEKIWMAPMSYSFKMAGRILKLSMSKA